MTIWLLACLVSLSVAWLSLAVTYGVGVHKRLDLCCDFWVARYRLVGKAETAVGPILEFSFTLILWASILLLVGAVYRGAADGFVAALLDPRPLPWVLAGTTTALTVWTCFFQGPREHDELIRGGDRKTDHLPPSTRERLEAFRKGIADDPEEIVEQCRRSRRTYRAYWLYSLNNGLLLVPLFWIIVAGVSADFSAREIARGALDSAQQQLSGAAIGPPLLERGEDFLRSFWVYKEVMIHLAKNLVGVVATCLLLAFWVLGTGFQAVYTGFVVVLMRALAWVALLSLVAGVSFVYVDLTEAGGDASSELAKIAVSIDSSRISLENKHDFNELQARVDAAVTVDSFWRRLINSYGGILLLIGAGVSIWRRQKRSMSVLFTLLGRWGYGLVYSQTSRAIFTPPLPREWEEKLDEEAARPAGVAATERPAAAPPPDGGR